MLLHVHLHSPETDAKLDTLNRQIHALTLFGAQIMSKISEQVTAQKEAFATIRTHLDGIGADIKSIKDKLDAINTSPGAISAEDQALLDSALADAQSIADRTTALDDLTPPDAPPADQPTQPA